MQTGDHISKHLNLKSGPQLRVTKQIANPILMGLLHPMILLPNIDYGQKELDTINEKTPG